MTDDAIASLAPTGVLRAAINFGNPVLAQRDPSSGAPRGISVDLANELARRLDIAVRYVTFDAAGKVVAATAEGKWDVAFLAIDPARATEVLFTAPYCTIEGSYMVRDESPLKRIHDVDRSGIRVTVADQSAYDLFLTRTLDHAEIVRAPTGNEAIELFLRRNYEVAAGVKGSLLQFAAQSESLRVMDDRFMTIEQAMGTLRGREAGWRYLCRFVEEMKAIGFVSAGLRRSGQLDAMVAPPAPPDP
jgi:polar amino acid transport system substrate-binding protein